METTQKSKIDKEIICPEDVFPKDLIQTTSVNYQHRPYEAGPRPYEAGPRPYDASPRPYDAGPPRPYRACPRAIFEKKSILP